MSDDNIKKTTTKGAQLVLERNVFYKSGYLRVRFLILFSILTSCILALSIGYKLYHPAQPQYFAATPNGRILQIFSLSKPVVSDGYVIQWTANKVRLAFALDYLHWHQQLQDVASSFTPMGWKYFVSSLKKSNNLSTLANMKMVSNVGGQGWWWDPI